MLSYLGFRFLQFLIRIMPFSVMYVLSDIIAFFLYRVIGYRKKIVRENICNAFPDKSSVELKKIESGFYSYFVDMMFEAGKGYNVSNKTIRPRYSFTNIEVIYQYYNENKSIILQMGHFNNWEWMSVVFGEFTKFKTFAIYRPIKNKYIDSYIRKGREKRDFHLVPIEHTGLMFRNITKHPCVFIFISDQSPIDSEKAFWTKFLNQETGFLHGTEVFAKKFNLPILFVKVMQKKRGYYDVTFVPIADDIKSISNGQATVVYAKMLETCIKAQPTRWLWSHRRWKRKKPKNKKMIF